MTTTKKVPLEACTFLLTEAGQDAEVLLAAATAESGGESRFEIAALSGKVIENHWWWGNLAIELSGIKGKGKVPVLVDHNVGLRIGVSDDREIDAKRGLVMRGKFLKSSPLAAQVRDESKDGFPWEASVRVVPLKVEQIPEGVEAEVNGQKVRGPGHIFRRSQLREVSFTALGADHNTSAAALSEASPELAVEFSTLATNEDTMTKKIEGAQVPEPQAPNEVQLAEQHKQAGIKAERDRVAAIRSAGTPEQAALVDELIVGGAEISAAQARLSEDLRTRFRVMMNQFANREGSLSGGNRGEQVDTKLAQINALEEGRDKWAAQWDHDASLRAQFLRKDDFLALRDVELAGWNPSRIRRRDDKGQPLAVRPWDEVALAASSPSSPVTIAGVRAGYAASLQAMLGLSWARQIASAFPTSSPSETYPWLRAVPNPRKWEGERTTQELRSDVVTIVNDDYENSIEFKVPDLRRDKTGQIMARAADLATRVAFFPEHLITALLTANGNAYDNVAFFATTHAVGSSGTINNNILAADGLAGGTAPSTAQMSTNLLLILGKMLAFLDDQAQPVNEAARQLMVMVPANLYGATVAAINAMFTSASATNPLGELARYGFSFTPVLNARLTTQNQFYVFRADAGIRSLLLQEEGVNPVELGPDSEHAKKTNRVLFGHGWAGGVGYGRFEMAIRGTTS
ncbi:MAG: Mu-like prophage major head subunit gpT family protein [Planctomycetes bacterium]|nr:Mu-like prophage major head subunit gpT family protein [Planctomycetota bacterium]